jgi:glycosyltransferase involved in cell wall biosynthesis
LTPSVSVVIPCYNRREIISRAIHSVLEQTFSPMEIIVVDDGSTDGSSRVARSFGGPVKVIEQPNCGAAVARNRGIRAALGDWVAFIDSDDEWHQDKLQLQVAAAERFPDAGLVFCDTLVRDEKEILMLSRFALGGLFGTEAELDGLFAAYDQSLFVRMLSQSRVITSAVMVRRGLTELHYPEDIWGSEDWALWLKLALRYRFVSVNQVLVTMHQQGDNISACKGRLYRNDVKVLKALRADPQLSETERILVQKELEIRRVGALYHSLIRGETRESRPILTAIEMEDLGRLRYYIYMLLTYMPPMVVRQLAALRLASDVSFSFVRNKS